MLSAGEPVEVNSGADGRTEAKTDKMDVQSDDVDQLSKKSDVQPLFLSPDSLTGHSKLACSVCGERCFSLAQLARHVQFHDRDRPFPCAVCGKRFLSRSHHSEHQRVHTGERPFPCSRCERAFTTHHNLKRHQLIHDKEETYRCSVCGVLFCQQHQLGNINGIIRVLKQHDMEKLIHPEANADLRSSPTPEATVENFQNFKLRGTFKEEQKTRKKTKKLKHTQLDLEEDHDHEREEKQRQPSFQSEIPQILKSKEDFSDLVLRTGPKIQKIAYDIEIII